MKKCFRCGGIAVFNHNGTPYCINCMMQVEATHTDFLQRTDNN